MSLRFQADADLNPEIGRGLRRREPAIDFRGAAVVLPDGTSDQEVLQIAAQAGRVLVSRDVTTMPGHFERFVALHESPGVLLIPSRRSISEVIEGLLLVMADLGGRRSPQPDSLASASLATIQRIRMDRPMVLAPIPRLRHRHRWWP